MNNTLDPRPRVLILISHYLPGFKAGGPIRSISNLVERLGSEYDFRLMTSDRDLGETSRYKDAIIGGWQHAPGVTLYYVGPGFRGWISIWLQLIKSDHDVLYLNGVFSRPYSMLPLLLLRVGLVRKVPVIVAPRGEFSLGALRLKPIRKYLFLLVIRLLNLDKGILWHSSSEIERQDILNQFGDTSRTFSALPLLAKTRGVDNASIFTAADLGGRNVDPQEHAPRGKIPGVLKVVFLSRISRMKNLEKAIQLLSNLPGEITFDIYGPIEDRHYWEKCKALSAMVSANVQISYRGLVAHQNVPSLFQQYHVLFLPTHGENFGHVILESLSEGCPVLISDQTPWRDLGQRGVGWDIPLSQPDTFRTILNSLVNMGGEEYESLSVRAKGFARELLLDVKHVEAYRAMFGAAASQTMGIP